MTPDGRLIDFARASPILTKKQTAGEPRWLRGPIGRPLEPDAGNAAEGSEGPMPDWRFQPCDFPRMAFLFQTELTKWTK